MARVAVNLRGVGVDEVARGDVLLTPRAWHVTTTLDARLVAARGQVHDPADAEPLPSHVMVHLGTLAVEARVRPLGPGAVRLALPAPLPVVGGDRILLRDPGSRRVVGAVVVDADPPVLDRRGSAARRAEVVRSLDGVPDLAREVARRGWMTQADAASLGIVVPPGEHPAATVTRRGAWLVDDEAWPAAARRLHAAVQRRADSAPIDPVLALEAARAAAGVPDRALVADLAVAAGLEVRDGRVGLPGRAAVLASGAEAALSRIEERLRREPVRRRRSSTSSTPPDSGRASSQPPRATAASSGCPVTSSCCRTRRRSPCAQLAALPQPFTTSDARKALDSTRRVVIPLLEHLDRRGWTRRLDGSHREVAR